MALAVLLGAPLLRLLDAFPDAVLGVLLTFSGLELAKAGRHLADEPDLTVGYVTAAATLTLKTGIGCAVGLSAALACGGLGRIWALARGGELGRAVLRDVCVPRRAARGVGGGGGPRGPLAPALLDEPEQFIDDGERDRDATEGDAVSTTTKRCGGAG